MRGVSLQAKTNMQRVALCLLALLMCSVECGRPAVLPSTIPDPLAYYALDDGSGFELRDTVSGADSGRVLYDANHQSTTYTEPNWTDDERFNKTIQCGAKNGAGEQKDTLQLADVDYGHSGAWSLSVWFRHDPENFDGKEREQFIGHGDAREANGNPNHFHVQMENSFAFRTGCDGEFVDTRALIEAHDTNWHQYTFTMRPGGGTGFDVYIDGVLEAQSNTMHESSPFDPVGPIRLCGREKADGWDPERYFLGKVAHFAIWDSALTSEQVQALNAAYDQAYPPITVNFTAVYVAPVDARHLRQAIGFPIVVIVGLLPGLISCLCARLRATKSGDWKERVRARGRRAMLGAGWLLLVLSLAPTVAYVIGQNMVFDASVLLYCALMLPVGIVCFMLNAIPADLSGGMVLAFFITVYALIILVAAGLAVLLSGAMQIVFFVQAALSVVGAVATSTVCCIPKGPKQSEKKLLRLWLTSRIFSILLGISFFFLLVDTTWHNSALISWNIATIVVGLEFVVLGAVTTPRCRSALTIMIATVGLGGNEEAAGAAKIVFAPLFPDEISPAASEMTTATA